ncbi:hypothetical protein JL722_120 [Aureococcus anophagefferens]|nr:hypothetical protein JL722_120 [Aureococcus anophagefferens]
MDDLDMGALDILGAGIVTTNEASKDPEEEARKAEAARHEAASDALSTAIKTEALSKGLATKFKLTHANKDDGQAREPAARRPGDVDGFGSGAFTTVVEHTREPETRSRVVTSLKSDTEYEFQLAAVHDRAQKKGGAKPMIVDGTRVTSNPIRTTKATYCQAFFFEEPQEIDRLWSVFFGILTRGGEGGANALASGDDYVLAQKLTIAQSDPKPAAPSDDDRTAACCLTGRQCLVLNLPGGLDGGCCADIEVKESRRYRVEVFVYHDCSTDREELPHAVPHDSGCALVGFDYKDRYSESKRARMVRQWEKLEDAATILDDDGLDDDEPKVARRATVNKKASGKERPSKPRLVIKWGAKVVGESEPFDPIEEEKHALSPVGGVTPQAIAVDAARPTWRECDTTRHVLKVKASAKLGGIGVTDNIAGQVAKSMMRDSVLEIEVQDTAVRGVAARARRRKFELGSVGDAQKAREGAAGKRRTTMRSLVKRPGTPSKGAGDKSDDEQKAEDDAAAREAERERLVEERRTRAAEEKAQRARRQDALLARRQTAVFGLAPARARPTSPGSEQREAPGKLPPRPGTPGTDSEDEHLREQIVDTSKTETQHVDALASNAGLAIAGQQGLLAASRRAARGGRMTMFGRKKPDEDDGGGAPIGRLRLTTRELMCAPPYRAWYRLEDETGLTHIFMARDVAKKEKEAEKERALLSSKTKQFQEEKRKQREIAKSIGALSRKLATECLNPKQRNTYLGKLLFMLGCSAGARVAKAGSSKSKKEESAAALIAAVVTFPRVLIVNSSDIHRCSAALQGLVRGLGVLDFIEEACDVYCAEIQGAGASAKDDDNAISDASRAVAPMSENVPCAKKCLENLNFAIQFPPKLVHQYRRFRVLVPYLHDEYWRCPSLEMEMDANEEEMQHACRGARKRARRGAAPPRDGRFPRRVRVPDAARPDLEFVAVAYGEMREGALEDLSAEMDAAVGSPRPGTGAKRSKSPGTPKRGKSPERPNSRHRHTPKRPLTPEERQAKAAERARLLEGGTPADDDEKQEEDVQKKFAAFFHRDSESDANESSDDGGSDSELSMEGAEQKKRAKTPKAPEVEGAGSAGLAAIGLGKAWRRKSMVKSQADADARAKAVGDVAANPLQLEFVEKEEEPRRGSVKGAFSALAGGSKWKNMIKPKKADLPVPEPGDGDAPLNPQLRAKIKGDGGDDDEPPPSSEEDG